MRKTKFLKAFTLAEVLATVVILGVIAAITIPSTLHRVTERQNKTRVRKAMTTYQTLVEKMIIENNIGRSTEALNQWANNDGNCTNARRYLKGSRDGCIFRSADGLWYNITNISETIIGFDNHGQPTNVQNNNIALGDENKAFALVTSFDQNGSIRVQDHNYETNVNARNGGFMREGAKSWATRKVECYLNNENCNRDRDICVGDGNNQRCIARRQGQGNQCRIQMGWVLRLNGVGNGGMLVQPNNCNIDEFVDNNNNPVESMTCGTDRNNNNNHACIIGGYGCEVVSPNEIQCHINGGEVSDISYNMQGEVTNVQCNAWNQSCVDARNPNNNMANPRTCKTACCSYNRNTNTWDNSTCGSDAEHFLWQKAICELIQMQGNPLPESCNGYMN